MSGYHIAQVNIGRMVASLDDPKMKTFVAALPVVNALADTSPGFVWRYQTELGNATSLRAYDDDLILINFSVWESIDALKAFVYKSDHGYWMGKRRRWFEVMTEQHMALWWIPAGYLPTWEEAQARLDALRADGPTPFAFTFRAPFSPAA
jgi:hypothetical protein